MNERDDDESRFGREFGLIEHSAPFETFIEAVEAVQVDFMAYINTAPTSVEAARSITLGEADRELTAMHEGFSAQFGCHPGEPEKWAECEQFACLRIQGVCHTVYVVTNALDMFCHFIYNMLNDGGPPASLRCEVSAPIYSWAQAMLRGAALVLLDDGEVTEQFAIGQRFALTQARVAARLPVPAKAVPDADAV